MTVLNVPYINQLTEGTLDGQPNENSRWNCVADVTCMGLEYETGKSYNGDAVKDLIYGQGYQGGQAAIRYVDYCHQQGVKLYAYNSQGATLDQRQWSLVREIHSLVDAGHPVMATIPSQWGIAQADPEHPSGTTHVILFNETFAGGLAARNPWNLPRHDGSDQYWHDRLCYAQVWIFAKEGTISPVGVPTGWKDVNGVITAPNGKTVLFGDAQYIRDHAWEADNVPVDNAEVYVSNLLAQDGRWGPGSRRVFRNCLLVYPTNPTLPGLTPKVVVRVDALGPELTAAEAQVTHLAQQNLALTAQVASLTQQLAALTADEQKDEASITNLTHELALAGPAAEEISQIEKILGVTPAQAATPTAPVTATIATGTPPPTA